MKFADVKVGVIIVLQGKYACRLIEVNLLIPGKPSSAKKTVVGLDIVTDKKFTDVFRPFSIIKEPTITQELLQVLWIDGKWRDDEGYIHLQDKSGNFVDDITTIHGNVNDTFLVDIAKAFEENKVVDITLMTVVVDEVTKYKVTLK